MPEMGVAGWKNIGWTVEVDGTEYAVALKWINGWRINMIIEVDGVEFTRAKALTRRALKGEYPFKVGSKVFKIEVGGNTGGKIRLLRDGVEVSAK